MGHTWRLTRCLAYSTRRPPRPSSSLLTPVQHGVGPTLCLDIPLHPARESGRRASQSSATWKVQNYCHRQTHGRTVNERVVERESEPTVRDEAFFSLAASYLQRPAGEGGARQGLKRDRAVQESEAENRDRQGC